MGGSAFGWPGVGERLRAAPGRAFGIPPALLRSGRELASFQEVVAHWLVPCGYPLGVHARRAGRCQKLEVWAHGADVRLLTRLPLLARRAIRSLLGVEASFVFVSQGLLDDLSQVLDPSTARQLQERSRIEPAPIDVPARATLSDPRTQAGSYLVWVGRDTPGKRLDLAIETARRANVRLVVVGSDRGLGVLPRNETLRWIAHARALVVTSIAEGAPTVVREARALDVPVIAFPCGDLRARARADRGITLVETEADLQRAMTAADASALGEHADEEARREWDGAEEDERHREAGSALR